jgi:hypothetical protein
MGRRRRHINELLGATDPLLNGPEPLARDSLTAATLALWQPKATRQLTAEDAREMAANIVGFFRLLHEWDLADRRNHKTENHDGSKKVSSP